MYINCKGCGSSNRDRDASCYNCGQPLNAAIEPQDRGPIGSSSPTGAFFCDPSNEVVVRHGGASLPYHAQSALKAIPLVGSIFVLVPLMIGWDGPFFGGAVAISAGMVALLLLMTWMLKATAKNEAILRSQGRVIRGEITRAERKPGGKNSHPRIEMEYTFQGDAGLVKAHHWRSIGNLSDFTSLKAPDPGTPCYVLYCHDKLYRML